MSNVDFKWNGFEQQSVIPKDNVPVCQPYILLNPLTLSIKKVRILDEYGNRLLVEVLEEPPRPKGIVDEG